MSTIDKVYKLIRKIQDVCEEIDHLEFEVNERENYEESQNLHSANCKYRRLKQKLRKQMAKYLEETHNG